MKKTPRYLAYASCCTHDSRLPLPDYHPGGRGHECDATIEETAVLTGVLNSTGGQNPTVKIRWGDEDRGTAVTPPLPGTTR